MNRSEWLISTPRDDAIRVHFTDKQAPDRGKCHRASLLPPIPILQRLFNTRSLSLFTVILSNRIFRFTAQKHTFLALR